MYMHNREPKKRVPNNARNMRTLWKGAYEPCSSIRNILKFNSVGRKEADVYSIYKVHLSAQL